MRHRSALIFVVLLALLGGSLGPAMAASEKQRKSYVDRMIDKLRHDLSETSQELSGAIVSLKRAEAELPGAQAQVAKVRGQLAAAQARDRMLAGKLDVAKAEVQKAKRAIRATELRIEAAQQAIGRIASSSYRQGSYAELAVVLQSDTPDDFATRLVLVQNAMRSQGAVLGNLAEDKANLAAEKATLDAKKEQLAEMKREQEALIVKIKGLEAKAVAAQHEVERLIAARASAVQTIERAKAAEERRYQAMQAESRRLQRVLAERARQARIAAARAARGGGGSGGGGGGGGGALSWPASGGITSPYGMRVHPVTGVYKLHDGTDFGTGCGAPVRAAASGQVIQATLVGGYGNQLVIDHGVMRGAGVATSYSHLMRFTAHAGEHVGRGELIGYSGGGAGMYGAGYSTGCHLHFMVYVNGSVVNPMSWL
jgi:murein DD-endopeptidase MepM/ murein hydrolase activator NlpD